LVAADLTLRLALREVEPPFRDGGLADLESNGDDLFHADLVAATASDPSWIIQHTSSSGRAGAQAARRAS